MLQSFLGKLFLLLLGPAEISAPKGEPICNKHIEQANIESKPPVEYDGLHPAAFTLHEDELAPSHQARQHEVEDTHEAADLAQQAPAVDVVHEEQHEDRQLHTHADNDAFSELVIGITTSWLDNDDEGTDTGAD